MTFPKTMTCKIIWKICQQFFVCLFIYLVKQLNDEIFTSYQFIVVDFRHSGWIYTRIENFTVFFFKILFSLLLWSVAVIVEHAGVETETEAEKKFHTKSIYKSIICDLLMSSSRSTCIVRNMHMTHRFTSWHWKIAQKEHTILLQNQQ